MRAFIVKLITAITVATICTLSVVHTALGSNPIPDPGISWGGEMQDTFWNQDFGFCTDGVIVHADQLRHPDGTLAMEPGPPATREVLPFSLELTGATLGSAYTPSTPVATTVSFPASIAGSPDGQSIALDTPVSGTFVVPFQTSQPVGTSVTIRTERWDHGLTGPNAVADDLLPNTPADGSGGDDVKDFTGTLANCTVLPTTVASVSPLAGTVLAPNGYGWNNGTVNVTLSATDTGAHNFSSDVNVDHIVYSASGAQSFAGTTASGVTTSTFPVSNEGVTTISFRATDSHGNNEAMKSFIVNLDTTLPVVTYSPQPATYTIDQIVNIHCAASDPTSNGVSSGIASNTCSNISGPAYSFNPGTNSFAASATDNAGNTGYGSTSFIVRASYGSLCTLTKQFISGSSRYNALPLWQRTAVDRSGNALCQYLSTAQISLSPSQKARFVSAYQQGVQALVLPGWLAQSQADILVKWSRQL